MLTFRQPGDMARYVADNDPGQIAAGFSNLEDFLAAGNKIPEYKMGGRQPIQAFDAQLSSNPDLSLINKNPYGTEFVGIGADQTNLFGYRVPDEIIKAQEERRKNNPINMFNASLPDKLGAELTPINPTPGAQQATPSTPNTESFSQDVLRDSDGNALPNFTPIRSPGLPTTPTEIGIQDFETSARVQAPPLLDGTKGFPVTVSGPEGIASLATVPETNQFQGFDDRLTKIEEGIASLLQNRGQQFNFGMQPRFDFDMQPRFNMSGLGYFFNPQGGFYG